MADNSIYVTVSAESIKRGAVVPDCMTANGKIDVAKWHTITQERHDLMISFHTSTPVSNTISRNDLFDIINKEVTPGVPPTHLELTWDTDDIIAIEGKAGIPARGSDDVDYSVCLFEGVDAFDAPDTFVFTRATERSGQETVVFKTIANNTVVRFYDVSNDHP